MRQVEFGDLVLLLYLVALLREFAWVVPNNTAAWILTMLASLIVCYFYVATKPPLRERTPKQFWLIVGVPLLLVYGMRVAWPDISFDVLNYHILHSERAMRGWLFLPGDFFPSPAPFNPAPDILTGLSRTVLGYRMGTVINLLVLLWTGAILNKIMRVYFKSAWLRCAAILLILFTEHVLFEINNYMVDLLPLPLLLEATRLAVGFEATPRQRRRTILIALLLGASLTFKLSNLAFAIPIAAVYLYNLLSNSLLTWKEVMIGLAAAVVPLVPFSLFIFLLTRSPVFPLYNGIFKSPYWPAQNVFDPRWGPQGLVETICWPFVLFFRTDRLAEIAVYSGRMSLGFAAAVGIFSLCRDSRIRALSFITVAGALLWSAGSGYIRYGLYLELTSGVILVWLLHSFRTSATGQARVWRIARQSLVLAVLLAQSIAAWSYVYQFEWSMRPSIFTQRLVFTDELKELFRDRDLVDYLSVSDRQLLSSVDVWVESAYKTSAIEVLLEPDAPIIGFRMGEYFTNIASRDKFTRAMESAAGKRLFTMCDATTLSGARMAIAARGMDAGEPRPVSIPFFSRRTVFDLFLIEVLPRGEKSSTGEPQEGPLKGMPLPDSAFAAGLSVRVAPEALRADQEQTLYVRLKNASDTAWPGLQEQWTYQVTIGNRWLDEQGSMINDMDGRVALLHDLAPGEETELPLNVTAPHVPGIYLLEIDAIQEGVAWFSDRGSGTLRLRVKVDP
ncbi:MAG: hypothetical protein M3410_08850 [Acidobacteriota bacterium]|nr:hypothetical protein [Acidobacteriota bacterium]